MSFTLIDKTDRGILGEGRSRGMGFAFAKRKEKTLTLVGPISPCKDYLNDQLYSEVTGKPYTACGYAAKKEDCFEKDKAYLVFSICKAGARNSTEYPTYKSDIKQLEANYENIEKFMHFFEKMLDVKERTSIEKIEDNKFVAIAPIFWMQATYMVSLYSLLIRVALTWDGKVDPLKFCKECKDEHQYHLNAAIPEIELMVKDGVPKQDFTKNCSWHGMGIVYLKYMRQQEEANKKLAATKK